MTTPRGQQTPEPKRAQWAHWAVTRIAACGLAETEGFEPSGQALASSWQGRDGPNLINPRADPLARELSARTRGAYAQRGVRQNRQKALTKDALQRLLATCYDSPKGIRDRALLLFAWSTGGRRRSEVT